MKQVQQPMTPLSRILLAFGASTAACNAILYFTLHSVLKYHGRFQLGLCVLGTACALIALASSLWRRHCFFFFHRWVYSRLETYRACERCGDIQFL